MHRRVDQVKAERMRLQAALRDLGLDVRDSAANFLLVKAGREASSALLRHGLVVRTFPASSVLADYIRITVRRPEENARLVAALKSSLARAVGS
jgi:histidinol-phosphate/aromatic aminotransferase/cobyric acid decarboxylase-like protein